MIYFYILASLSIVGLLYMRFEAGFVEVKRVRLTKSKKNLKIIQLSDIHIQYLKVSSEKVRRIIDSENPDLIILTGDYIEKPAHIPTFLELLHEIKGSHNMLLCLGNHDYTAFSNNNDGLERFIRLINDMGVTVLHNDSICYEKNSKKYNITGIGDLRSKRNDINAAIKSLPCDAFMNIAFSHNPDIALQLPKGKFDYLLSGHFHGGQIWMPFDLEFKTLRNEKLCRMGVKRGLHKVNGTNLYINRGLGNVCFPLRFLSRPEITVFYLP